MYTRYIFFVNDVSGSVASSVVGYCCYKIGIFYGGVLVWLVATVTLYSLFFYKINVYYLLEA